MGEHRLQYAKSALAAIRTLWAGEYAEKSESILPCRSTFTWQQGSAQIINSAIACDGQANCWRGVVWQPLMGEHSLFHHFVGPTKHR